MLVKFAAGLATAPPGKSECRWFTMAGHFHSMYSYDNKCMHHSCLPCGTCTVACLSTAICASQTIVLAGTACSPSEGSPQQSPLELTPHTDHRVQSWMWLGWLALSGLGRHCTPSPHQLTSPHQSHSKYSNCDVSCWRLGACEASPSLPGRSLLSKVVRCYMQHWSSWSLFVACLVLALLQHTGLMSAVSHLRAS